MSRIVVKMSPEDFAVFTNIAKYPFTASVLPPKLRSKYTAPEHVKKTIRQRILAYVEQHPGETYKQVRRNVKGTEGVIVVQLTALREEGLLRVDRSTRGLYVADTMVQEAAA